MNENAPKEQQILHGNFARVKAGKDVESQYITQAISNYVNEKKNTPLVSDIDVKRERDWNIENKK